MTRPLHIVQCGNQSVPWCTEVHLRMSMEALGHTVTFVQEAPRAWRTIAKIIATQPVDLVVYTRTESIGMDRDGAAELWAQCEMRGVASCTIHLDVFWGLDREHLVTRDNPLFGAQFIFTADGDHQDEFATRGINHHFLPPGVVYEGCYIGTPRAEYDGDVAWVGSGTARYHHEWPRRPELVAALQARYGDRLTRAGDGRTVRERDLNDLYASCKVSAGDSLAPLREASTYHSDRLPESLGRGSILVHPLMEPARDLYGEHVVWCGWDVEEQLEKIDEVLAWDEWMRNERIANTVEFIKAHHSYRSRVQTVLDTIGL